MATNIQHSVIAGRLTKKPELKQTTSAPASFICSFTIAVNLGSGDDKYTEFNECVAFGKTAETIARCFNKGDEIEVICSKGWRTREWKSADGTPRFKMEHRVSDFNFVGNRMTAPDQVPAKAPETPSTPQFSPPTPNFEATGDEDLPF